MSGPPSLYFPVHFPLSAVMGTGPAPVQDDTRGIWLLGSYYGPINEADSRWGEYHNFLRHFTSRLWITYRSGFESIRPTYLTSDAGWGCMLRSGQMLLGETLIRQFLGKDWRLGYNRKHILAQYAKIVSWFFDHMSPDSPFSIHRIAVMGKQFGKEIGEWFGPATISSVLQALVAEFDVVNFSVYIATDGVIYKDKLAETCCGEYQPGIFAKESAHNWKGVLILVPLRLGLDTVTSVYEEGIKDCFRFPQSVGIAGGRPNSSLYFIGLDGDYLIYLDPHYTRSVIDFAGRSIENYTEADLETYHCTSVRKIHISKIDPSLLVGFFCKTKDELLDLLDRLQAQKGQGVVPIVAVDEKSPVYNDSVDIEHVDENSDEEASSDFDML